jgi:hypothetical protein
VSHIGGGGGGLPRWLTLWSTPREIKPVTPAPEPVPPPVSFMAAVAKMHGISVPAAPPLPEPEPEPLPQPVTGGARPGRLPVRDPASGKFRRAPRLPEDEDAA